MVHPGGLFGLRQIVGKPFQRLLLQMGLLADQTCALLKARAGLVVKWSATLILVRAALGLVRSFRFAAGVFGRINTGRSGHAISLSEVLPNPPVNDLPHLNQRQAQHRCQYAREVAE